jgi:hypothetical protein
MHRKFGPSISRYRVRAPWVLAKKSSNDRWVVGSVAIITAQFLQRAVLSGLDGVPLGETAHRGNPSPAPRDAWRENPSWWISTITWIPLAQAAAATD